MEEPFTTGRSSGSRGYSQSVDEASAVVYADGLLARDRKSSLADNKSISNEPEQYLMIYSPPIDEETSGLPNEEVESRSSFLQKARGNSLNRTTSLRSRSSSGSRFSFRKRNSSKNVSSRSSSTYRIRQNSSQGGSLIHGSSNLKQADTRSSSLTEFGSTRKLSSRKNSADEEEDEVYLVDDGKPAKFLSIDTYQDEEKKEFESVPEWITPKNVIESDYNSIEPPPSPPPPPPAPETPGRKSSIKQLVHTPITTTLRKSIRSNNSLNSNKSIPPPLPPRKDTGTSTTSSIPPPLPPRKTPKTSGESLNTPPPPLDTPPPLYAESKSSEIDSLMPLDDETAQNKEDDEKEEDTIAPLAPVETKPKKKERRFTLLDLQNTLKEVAEEERKAHQLLGTESLVKGNLHEEEDIVMDETNSYVSKLSSKKFRQHPKLSQLSGSQASNSMISRKFSIDSRMQNHETVDDSPKAINNYVLATLLANGCPFANHMAQRMAPKHLASVVETSYFSVESFSRAMSFIPSYGDVVVASTIHTGQTPIIEMIDEMLLQTKSHGEVKSTVNDIDLKNFGHVGNPEDIDPTLPLVQRIPWIESSVYDGKDITQFAQKHNGRRVFKTNLSCRSLRPNMNRGTKYVTIFRDPIDLRLSQYRYLRKLYTESAMEERSSFDRYHKLDYYSKVACSPTYQAQSNLNSSRLEDEEYYYEDDLAEWVLFFEEYPSQVMIIFYEDLITNPINVAKSLAEFLNDVPFARDNGIKLQKLNIMRAVDRIVANSELFPSSKVRNKIEEIKKQLQPEQKFVKDRIQMFENNVNKNKKGVTFDEASNKVTTIDSRNGLGADSYEQMYLQVTGLPFPFGAEKKVAAEKAKKGGFGKWFKKKSKA